jgi:hypothetical protein
MLSIAAAAGWKVVFSGGREQQRADQRKADGQQQQTGDPETHVS